MYTLDELMKSMRACTDSFNEHGNGRAMTEEVGLPFDELTAMVVTYLPPPLAALLMKGIIIGLHLAQNGEQT